jgi:Transglycosylase SLT domain
VTVDAGATAACGHGARTGLLASTCGVLILLAFVFTTALTSIVGARPGGGGETVDPGYQAGVSALAERDIPLTYLGLYERAGVRYGVSWAILAGIGKVECDHGRDPAPSCTRTGAVNAAGAGGPMQFIAATWARYGVDAEGDGAPDRWNPADAIFAAANYLRACGAPGNYRRAILAYNHSEAYADQVERWAASYRAPRAAPVGVSPSAEAAGEGGEGEPARGEDPAPLAGADARLREESQTAVRFTAGERAVLAPGDGHLALIPAGVPEVVQAMVVAGNELQDLPYGPGGHPDPLGASQEDCSSTVNYVLYRSGVRALAEIVNENPLAQDYLDWGAPGPGRWVTIYAADTPTPHVFIVIAGLRLDTSHDGSDVGPNRDEDGPRWRILDRIPTWARWAVRHPPGL